MAKTGGLFNLSILLEQEGLNEEKRKKTMLVRHSLNAAIGETKKLTIRDVYKPEFFYAFQCEQNSEIFKGYDYILSFVGEEKKLSRFVGCYKVGSVCSGDEKLSKMPLNYPDVESFHKGVYYNLEEADYLERYKNRLIIRWANNNRKSWFQPATVEMSVVAVEYGTPFPGYEQVHLSFQELKDIIDDDNIEWKTPLSKVCGVYLITTPKGLYIGSAYGNNGIWNRWKEYSQLNNLSVEIKALVETDSRICNDFEFSLLKVLPKKTNEKDVMFWEQYFKKVLNTIHSDWGLNMN